MPSIFGNGRGTSDRNVAGSNSIVSESRTRVSRMKGNLYNIDIFGCQHPFCFVDRLARKSSYGMALMPDRIKVGVRSGHATMSWAYIIEIIKTKQTD